MLKIILEGADNSGKTTLSEILRSAVPHTKYMHPGGAPGSFAEEARCVEEQTEYLVHNQFCILDRTTTISQRVYNPDSIGDRYRAKQLDTMLQTGALIIYCRPTTDKLMSFEKFQWKDYDSEQHKQKIITQQHLFIERYDALMRRTPHIAYNFGDEESAQQLIDACINGLKGDASAIHLLRNLPGIHLRKDL